MAKLLPMTRYVIQRPSARNLPLAKAVFKGIVKVPSWNFFSEDQKKRHRGALLDELSHPPSQLAPY